jgi:integrase
MSIKKILPRLHDFKGNTSQAWFVLYENGKGGGVPARKYISQKLNAEQRYAEAQRLILELGGTVQLIAARDKTQTNLTKQITFEWIATNSAQWRQSTHRAYLTKAKLFFQWLKDRKVCFAAVSGFIDYLKSLGRHSKTINTYINTLKLFNRKIWKIQHLFEGVETVRVKSVPARYFTRLQAKDILAKMRTANYPLWVACQMQMYCFIRPNELRQLQIGDISLEDLTIHIKASVSKNGKSQTVCIPTAFIDILADFMANRVLTAYLFGTDTKPHRKNKFCAQHQEFIEEMGYDTKEYKFYSWKHTGAYLAVRAGIHAKDLQIQMRHHSLDETDKYLRQLSVSELKDFADKMPRL